MDKNVQETCGSESVIYASYSNIRITQQDLDHPTKEFVIDTYHHLRNAIEDCFLQVTGEASIKSQELPADSDSICELLRFLNKYFVFITKQDGADSVITLIDIYAPTAKRTKVRIKLLFNFVEFFEKQTEPIGNVIMFRKMQATRMCSLMEEKEQLRTKLAAEAESAARHEDQLNKLKKQLKEVESSFASLLDKKDDKEQHWKKLQQDFKTILDTYENKQTLLKNLKKNIASLNEQVVAKDSYDSLSDLKTNLSKKSDELESETVNMAERISSKVHDIDCVKAMHKQMEVLLTLARELQSNTEIFNEKTSELKLLENKYKAKVKDIQTKNKTILKLKLINKERIAELQCLVVKNNNAIQQIHDETKQINFELEEERKTHIQLKEDEAILKGAISKLQNKLEEKKLQINHSKNRDAGMYTRIINAENTLTTTFNKALENILEIGSDEE